MQIENNLQVYDNVFPDVHKVREWALGLDFRSNDYQGQSFSNTAGDWGRFPVNLLSDLMGFKCEVVLSFVRANLASDEPAKRPFIHCDQRVDGAEYAAVIYLTNTTLDRDNYSATAFWRHKETGIANFPKDPNDLLRIGYDKDIFDKLNADGFSEKNWQLEGLVRAVSNRMIIYPSLLFHSRYPDLTFGDKPENGRLIWCAFFREAA